MVSIGAWGERRLAVSVKAGSLTVEVSPPGQAVQVVSVDHAGRLWSALFNGVTYRRALDGHMLAKWRPPGQPRQRRRLHPPETQAIEERARRLLADLSHALRRGEAHLHPPLSPLGQRTWQRALTFDLQADAQRFARIYRPIGILPPDQYLALVLQAAEGCPFNTCTFCTFYRDRPYRVKAPEAFHAHAEAVRDFLGDGLTLRRGIFLGDANALVVPMPRLSALLRIARQVFPEPAFGRVYAFLDGFSGRRKTAQDYATLAELGLTRVYIGMESGHDPLLAFLQKPGRAADVLTTVQALKAGGVAVGIIVLLGAGGARFAEAHVRDTVALLNAMPLDQRDLLYFSDLIVSPGMPYAQQAAAPDLHPLDYAALRAQEQAIRQGLTFPPGKGPRISRYDIREFVY